eukprot:s369_g26.t1
MGGRQSWHFGLRSNPRGKKKRRLQGLKQIASWPASTCCVISYFVVTQVAPSPKTPLGCFWAWLTRLRLKLIGSCDHVGAWRLLHGEEPGCWCGCSGSATAAASSRSRCAPFHCSHRRFHPCSLELRLADDARDGRALGGPRCRGLQCCTERLRERSSVDQGNEPSAALPSIVASRCHQLQHGFGELCLACSTQIYHGITGVPTRQGHSEHRGSKLGCLSPSRTVATGSAETVQEGSFCSGYEAKSWSKALGLYALSHLCHARRDKLLPSANAAMSACTSQGCWPVAIEILQHMQRSRCRGDAITLGQCARSFQLGVLWLNALELLEGKGEGHFFDKQIANLVIQSCALSRHFSSVFRVLKHGDAKGLSMAVASAPWTLALAMLLHSSGSRLPKSTVAFNSGISVCKASRWPFASELLQMMSQCMLRLDNFSFHAAADLSENSNWAFSLSFLDMMKQMLVEQDLITQGVNMSVLSGSQLWEEGQLLLDLLNAQQILPDLLVCSSAISACAASPGGWTRALKFTAALADSAAPCRTSSQLKWFG